MSSMLDEIEYLISHNSKLGEYLKLYQEKTYIELLKDELNCSEIWLEDIDAIVYVYSKENAQFWYETLNFTKDHDEIAKNMLQYENRLKTKVVIKNKKDYLKLHPKQSLVAELLNEKVDFCELKSIIDLYYQYQIKQFIKSQCTMIDFDNDDIEYDISLNCDLNRLAGLIIKYCNENEYDIENFIDSPMMYLYLIRNQYILINITIETTYSRYKLNTLKL